jgi:hypothetical protein
MTQDRTEARRVPSRIVWAIGVTLVLTLVLTVPLAAFGFVNGRPLDVGRADVAGVDRQSLPMGPGIPGYSSTAPVDRRHLLAKIDQFIPDPLPHPVWQGFGCDGGWETIVTLVDGRAIIYGPCHIPSSIMVMWGHINDMDKRLMQKHLARKARASSGP